MSWDIVTIDQDYIDILEQCSKSNTHETRCEIAEIVKKLVPTIYTKPKCLVGRHSTYIGFDIVDMVIIPNTDCYHLSLDILSSTDKFKVYSHPFNQRLVDDIANEQYPILNYHIKGRYKNGIYSTYWKNDIDSSVNTNEQRFDQFHEDEVEFMGTKEEILEYFNSIKTPSRIELPHVII